MTESVSLMHLQCPNSYSSICGITGGEAQSFELSDCLLGASSGICAQATPPFLVDAVQG